MVRIDVIPVLGPKRILAEGIDGAGTRSVLICKNYYHGTVAPLQSRAVGTLPRE